MASPASSIPARTGLWSIHYPALNQTVPAGLLTVQVDDAGAGHQYLATVYNDGAPTPQYGGTLMTLNVATGYDEVTFLVAAPPSDKNVIVYVLNEPGDFRIRPFRVAVGGTGSSGTGGATILLSALGASIPATLHAHLSNAGTQSGVYALTYDRNEAAWTSDAVGLRLRCVRSSWQLDVQGARAYHPRVAACGPSQPFQITFEDVNLSSPGAGAATNAAVEILVSG